MVSVFSLCPGVAQVQETARAREQAATSPLSQVTAAAFPPASEYTANFLHYCNSSKYLRECDVNVTVHVTSMKLDIAVSLLYRGHVPGSVNVMPQLALHSCYEAVVSSPLQCLLFTFLKQTCIHFFYKKFRR